MIEPEYPSAEFWAVVGDLCQQGRRDLANDPYAKTVWVEMTRPEFELLRLAYVKDGGNP